MRLPPYAGEADLMLTSHTVIANLLCTGYWTPNCTVAWAEAQDVMTPPVWPLSGMVPTYWHSLLPVVFPYGSFAPLWSLRSWQTRVCNFTDGEKATEVSHFPTLFYSCLLRKKVWMWPQGRGGLSCPFFEIILFSNAIETNKRGIVLKTLT